MLSGAAVLGPGIRLFAESRCVLEQGTPKVLAQKELPIAEWSAELMDPVAELCLLPVETQLDLQVVERFWRRTYA